jgi:hypothetical protein
MQACSQFSWTKLKMAMAEQACLRKALEEHSVAAEAACQLVAELALGLANYSLMVLAKGIVTLGSDVDQVSSGLAQIEKEKRACEPSVKLVLI